MLFLVGCVLAIVADGTAGAGDSPMHYQFARWAPIHPELFFHYWAKPFFVLISSPASQHGMIGIKLFNILLSSLTMLVAWRVALAVGTPNADLVPLFMAFMPAYISHSLSGYTEPLFAFINITCIWLYVRRHFSLSILLISFLPFVRSEGLIICGVFALILLIERRWYHIPLLAVGHLVYGVVGINYHETVLWVFTKVPYARLDSHYGIGTWGHFFKNLPSITGVPLVILLAVGAGYLLSKTFSKLNNPHGRIVYILVFGSAASYFTARVFFWALGIFNSMGLMRVLIAVVPTMAIIAVYGFQWIITLFPNFLFRKTVPAIILLYLLLFPFTSNTYAWHYKRDFLPNEEQQLIQQSSNYIKSNYPSYKEYSYFFDANCVSIELDIDFFGKKCHRTHELAHTPHGQSIIVWDDWYSQYEAGTPLQSLLDMQDYKLVKEFYVTEPWGNVRSLVLFVSKE
ncbi:MAG: hypothetical protein JNK66_03015 [Chitinophagales bacterium]|nr:hypothetical protein [Chitinophagales bacterium]